MDGIKNIAGKKKKHPPYAVLDEHGNRIGSVPPPTIHSAYGFTRRDIIKSIRMARTDSRGRQHNQNQALARTDSQGRGLQLPKIPKRGTK